MTMSAFATLWGMCALTNSLVWIYGDTQLAGKLIYTVLITAAYAFYFRKNIFDRGAWMGVGILALLFLTSGHPTGTTLVLSTLITLGMFASLGKVIPPHYLMIVTIGMVFAGYVFFFAFMLFRMNDRLMFTVFITTLFLYWYAWFQTVRLRTL